MKWQIVVFVSISINLCANPSNPLVVQGEASFYGIGSQTLQIVAADTTVIHWEDFSIASNELTQFIQPDVTSTVFNHVMTGNPSQLLGHLKANGNVYLFNPNGVLVGKDGKVDTAGFFCSTLDVLNEKGQYSGDSKASIVNQGTILASSGDVILLSYCVDNQGSIEAPSGVVGLGAGERILIQTTGDERLLIQPQVTAGSMLENSGQIVALQAELKSAGTPFALAINHKGSIDALSLQETGGKIFLVAGEGTVNVTGAMHAQVKDEGGTVHVLGHTVKVFENAVIDASGKNGGGTVLIGGDYRGSNPEIPNAQFTLVTDNSQIRADALQSGDGGKVIIWADNTTGF